MEAPKCVYCKNDTRPKEKKDWKKGEQLKKGKYIKLYNYYICTSKKCRKTSIAFKEVEGYENSNRI